MPSLGQRQRAQAAAAQAPAAAKSSKPAFTTDSSAQPDADTGRDEGSDHAHEDEDSDQEDEGDEDEDDQDGEDDDDDDQEEEEEESEEDSDGEDDGEDEDEEDSDQEDEEDSDDRDEDDDGGEDDDDDDDDYRALFSRPIKSNITDHFPFHLHLLDIGPDVIWLLWAAATPPAPFSTPASSGPYSSSSMPSFPTADHQNNLRRAALAVTVNGTPWPYIYLTELSPDGNQAVLVVHDLDPATETNLAVHAYPLNQEGHLSSTVSAGIQGQILVSFLAPVPGYPDALPSEPQKTPASLSQDSKSRGASESIPTTRSPVKDATEVVHSLPVPLTLEALRSTLFHSTEAREILSASLRKARKEASRTESSLRNEIDSLQRNLDRSSAADGRTKQKVLALQENVRQAKAAEERLGQEAGVLQADWEERQSKMNIARSERKKDKAQWEGERAKQEASIHALENAVKDQERRRDKLRTDLEEREKKRGKLDSKWAKVTSLEDELKRLKEEVAGVKEGAAVFAAALAGVSPIASPTSASAMSDQVSGSTLRATAPAFFAPQTSTSSSQVPVDDSALPSGALTPRSRLIREHALATATQYARQRATASPMSEESQSPGYRAYPHLGSLSPTSSTALASAISGRTLDPHKPEFVPTWLQSAPTAPQGMLAGTEVENAGDFGPGYRSEDSVYSQALYRAHELSQPNPYLPGPGQPVNLGYMQGFPDFAALEGYKSSDSVANSSLPPAQLPSQLSEDDSAEDAETDAETVDGDDLDFDPTLKLPPSFARSRQMQSSSASGGKQKPRPHSIVLSNSVSPSEMSGPAPSTPRHWPTSDLVPGLSFEHGIIGSGSAPASPTGGAPSVVKAPMAPPPPPPGLMQSQRSPPRFQSSSPTAFPNLSGHVGPVSPSLSMPGSPLAGRAKVNHFHGSGAHSGSPSPSGTGPRFTFAHRRAEQGSSGEGAAKITVGGRESISRTASE
ncbi:hypothetical protein CF327_g1292 [Tilletia walkeri]|nr:hypothetical protein CF327_g1292 [Tilletia walkeri]